MLGPDAWIDAVYILYSIIHCIILMPSLPVKIGIVVAGLVLYFFAISALLNIRRRFSLIPGDKAEQKVLFDSIDYNRDGVLTTNEINYFRPCPQSNRTTLVTRLNTLGPRVTYDQFENDISRSMSTQSLTKSNLPSHHALRMLTYILTQLSFQREKQLPLWARSLDCMILMKMGWLRGTSTLLSTNTTAKTSEELLILSGI